MTSIAFIGLGVMGTPMAGHLSEHFQVTAYNRSADKALKWGERYQGKLASDLSLAANQSISSDSFHYQSLTDVIKACDVIISCIGNDDDVWALANLVEKHGKPTQLWIDHTTTSSNIAKKIAERLASQAIDFIDAPISGGESGAVNGQLTIMCGGKDSAFQQAKTILAPYTKKITRIGDSGAGQLAKMVNQICIAGVLQGLSEGLHFAKELGVEANALIDAIGQGAAQSWQMDNRALTMMQDSFDFGFAIDLMVKDLNIVFDTANANHIPLPNTEAVLKRYQALQKKGLGRQDTSVLIKQFD